MISLPPRDYEKDFQEFWKPIICNEDGSINLEQLKKELSDCHTMMEEWRHTLYTLTGAKLSKPNYTSDVMIHEITEYFEKQGKS